MSVLLFGLAAARRARSPPWSAWPACSARGGSVSGFPGWCPLGGLELSLDPLGGLFLALVGADRHPGLDLCDRVRGRRATTARLAYLAFVSAMSLVPLAANVDDVPDRLGADVAGVLLPGAPRPRRRRVRRRGVGLRGHDPRRPRLSARRHAPAGRRDGEPDVSPTGASAAPDLTPGARVAPVCSCSALGFACKAGVIPLHVWLPRAHPAAPSHVSALMSGRHDQARGLRPRARESRLARRRPRRGGASPCCWPAPSPPSSASCTRVVERDLKRCSRSPASRTSASSSSASGAGLVFRGVGLGGLARAGASPPRSTTPSTTRPSRALLFLGAGAVVHATGTRNMDALGGLIERMPWTAACFLFGAAAIAGAAAAQRLRERVADLPGAAAERSDRRGWSSTSSSRSRLAALALTAGSRWRAS